MKKSKFFFVSIYDKISAVILTQLINVHPDILCVMLPTNDILNEPQDSALDDFISENESDKKFVGNIYNFPAFELQFKTDHDYPSSLFRKVNILVSPTLRIKFLIHSWLQSGLSPEQLVVRLEKQLLGEHDNLLLKRYKLTNFYEDVLMTLTSNIKRLIESKPDPIVIKNYIDSINSNQGKLFRMALAYTMAFDSVDMLTPTKSMCLEKILTDINEYVNLLNYITCDELNSTDDFQNTAQKKWQEANTMFYQIQSDALDTWQRDLLNECLSITYYPDDSPKSLAALYKQFGYAPINKKTYSKLISIQLNSIRPGQLNAFFDNIEDTADNPEEIEVLVNTNNDKMNMQTMLDKQVGKRKFTLKYISTPSPNSLFDLWIPLNDLNKITDPDAYFILNTSDKMFFLTKGWDTKLKEYVGFFPDHYFRLRTSSNKFRNYFDRWECSGSQDTISITTKRWIDVGGNLTPCFGPSHFQQSVAFYLAKGNTLSNKNIRDIPLLDIEFSTDVLSLGSDLNKVWKLHGQHIEKIQEGKSISAKIKSNEDVIFVRAYINDYLKAMQRLQSYPVQLEAKRRAMLIKAHILVQGLKQNSDHKIVDNKNKKVIEVRLLDKVEYRFSYKLNWLSILLENQKYKLNLQKFGCSFREQKNVFIGFVRHILVKNSFCYKLYLAYRMRKL